MPTEGVPKPDSPEQDLSGYEFQEISDLERWSSMENELYMTVNSSGPLELSFGHPNKEIAVDQITENNDRTTLGYVGETLDTLVIGDKNPPKRKRTKKKSMEPGRRPLVSFS
jgi:hypothetical protein